MKIFSLPKIYNSFKKFMYQKYLKSKKLIFYYIENKQTLQVFLKTSPQLKNKLNFALLSSGL